MELLKKSNSYIIKKIKLAGKNDAFKVLVEYEREFTDKGNDYFMLRSFDDAHPDLLEAFSSLRQTLLELCEIEDSFPYSAVTVKSVSFSNTSGILGAVISGSIDLMNSNSPLNINTPHKSVQSYSDNMDDIQVFTSGQISRLYHLHDEACEYIDGKRAQLSLFDEDVSFEMVDSEGVIHSVDNNSN